MLKIEIQYKDVMPVSKARGVARISEKGGKEKKFHQFPLEH